MKFQDNFSEILLVSEGDVIFYYEDKYLIQNTNFRMKLLNIKDSLTDPYIQIAITYFNFSPEQLRETTKINHAQNLWSLLNLVGLDSKNGINRSIQYYFQYVFGEQFKIENKEWKLNGIAVTEEIFARIQDISLVVAGMKKFNEQTIMQFDKPQWLLDKEAEIRKIKNQGKNQNGKNHFEELMKIFLPLNYELGYSFEELFQMNYYHIQYLSKYVPKIVGYDIQKRQIMSKKKLKYITDN